ncbi:MAG TPA: phytochelatin synthase [Cyanobacteria bacterium UBA12227]|nr:phytochelatin synthase [Cyanobacteria bacterium UBA12227]HAX85963.1 phytochelatin synthase [Cyanobacteria bacterium UBA11370]
MKANGFYRRPLPPSLISFSSSEGRQIFTEALALGGMEGYFALAEQFHTQSEPAFCGIGTLVVVLNALSIDPGRIWKGLWRWYGEEFLDCCQPLSLIKQQGITFDELVCLARCNGANVESIRYTQSSLENFRHAIRKATSSPQGLHMVVSYSRQVLGQTGNGHFSPVGGYHPERDLILILDVARFKYPPHWVPLPLLWEALAPIDTVTGKSRGYILLSKRDSLNHSFYYVAVDRYQWAIVAPYFTEILPTAIAQEQPNSLAMMVDIILEHFSSTLTAAIATSRDDRSTESKQIWHSLLNEIRSHPLSAIIQGQLSTRCWDEVTVIGKWLSQEDNLVEFLTVLLLSCPEELYSTLNSHLLHEICQLRELEKLPPLMGQEVARLREQMLALQDLLRVSIINSNNLTQ